MTKLAISLLHREDIKWFEYLYSNYCKYIKIEFILIINTATQEQYKLMETFIVNNNIKNVLLSEPFIKRTFGPDLWHGHMLNLEIIRNMADIDYVTFFASNCIFFKQLEEVDPNVNVLNDEYFTESIQKTDLYDKEYSFYLNKLGMSRPGIRRLNIEHFNPEKNCFKKVEGAWLHKISSDYNTVRKTITKNNLYYSQFECLTTNKPVIDKMIDFYWNNNLYNYFKKFDDWVLEEIFPITYFINNGHPFFYIGFNSDINQIKNDMDLIKNNKNYFYVFKIHHRIEDWNKQIVDYYNG
jgi:hypothetical protein